MAKLESINEQKINIMNLTGKCKKDFYSYYEDLNIPHYYINVDFKSLDDSMQYGVLVDFFESKDLCIEICKMHLSKYYYWMINDGAEENRFNSRKEARTAAIKKADELYNLK